MRLYELANEHNIDKGVLLQALQNAGFDVKNSLAGVDDKIVAWVEGKSSSDFEGIVPEGAESPGKPVKKKAKKVKAGQSDKEDEPEAKESVESSEAPSESEKQDAEEVQEEAKPKVKKKVKLKVKKRVSGAGLETEVPQEEPKPVEEPVPAPKPEQESHRQAEPEVEEVTVSEPEPVFEPAAKPVKVPVDEDYDEEEEVGKKSDRKSGKKSDKKAEKAAVGKDKKPDRQQSRKPKKHGQEIKLAPPPVEADLKGEDKGAAELIIGSEEEEERRTGEKHKRADFKSHSMVTQLPAGFQEQESNLSYARSMGGGAGGRRHRPRGAGRQFGSRRSRGRKTTTLKRERDPNAIAQVALGMTVRDLSTALGIKVNDILGYFMKSGQMVNVNDILSEEDINLIGEQFDVKYEWKSEQDLEQELQSEMDNLDQTSGDRELVMRPPVVTFMGHVDHGKTSLLDKIRSSRVAEGESGGITQHMGAYNVNVKDHEITFLDTPGHEAFTTMRARGANLTDIAVLVVAADDGVMPQTEEACSHARTAGVPIVIAINKCDVPNANPDKVRQELSTRLNLLPEEWGGSVGMVNVSAITGEGIDDLLERILLEAEMLELQADPNRLAVGHIVEAQVSENQGVVATLLISEGTLRRGDVVLSSSAYGKVKLMFDHLGHTIDKAGPGQPVRFIGLSNVPEAGDKLYVLDDISKARAIADQRERDARSAALSRRSHVTLENLTSHLATEGSVKELRIIIKADVKGSLEVLEKTLTDLATDEVRINVLHSAVGGVNQADIILADASDAIVVGFHVVADPSARLQASSFGVQVKLYHVIYRLIEDMRAALEGMLPPEEREVVQGHVQIRKIFKASRVGNIAGCYVLDGIVARNSKIRLTRNNIVIYDGVLDSLKRVKDDAKEVREGFECGLKIAGFDDIREADILEAYTIQEIARKLDS